MSIQGLLSEGKKINWGLFCITCKPTLKFRLEFGVLYRPSKGWRKTNADEHKSGVKVALIWRVIQERKSKNNRTVGLRTGTGEHLQGYECASKATKESNISKSDRRNMWTR